MTDHYYFRQVNLTLCDSREDNNYCENLNKLLARIFYCNHIYF